MQVDEPSNASTADKKAAESHDVEKKLPVPTNNVATTKQAIDR
ncbi:MAG TPA: hypothetical protein VGO47_00950 [Chlamydiales bacterium]|nr:hypothetical protein [Chlamydiales bacterium]